MAARGSRRGDRARSGAGGEAGPKRLRLPGPGRAWPHGGVGPAPAEGPVSIGDTTKGLYRLTRGSAVLGGPKGPPEEARVVLVGGLR